MLREATIAHRLESGEKITGDGLVQTEQIMRDSFANADTEHSAPMEVRIARRLVGTKQVKLAGVSEASLAAIADQVRQFVAADMPVPIIAASGAKKDKAGTLEGQSPDIAELTSLTMLASMNDAVRAVYSPGIKAQIIHEDRGDVYLNGDDPETPGFVERYMHKLDTLVEAFACLQGVVFMARESDLLRRANINSQEDFEREAEQYFQVFLAYLRETDPLDDSQWGTTESAKQLGGIGWIGGIPREMRDFYYERARLIYRTNDPGRLTRNLARMFAGVLLRKKSQVIGRMETIDPEYARLEGASAVRCSFAPPSPGMPTRHGRFFLRPKPEKVCTKGIPYWAADGVMVQRHAGSRKGILPGIRPRDDARYRNMTRLRAFLSIWSAKQTTIDADLLVDTGEHGLPENT